MDRRRRDAEVLAQVLLRWCLSMQCLITRNKGEILTLQGSVSEADSRRPEEMGAEVDAFAQPRPDALPHFVKLALGEQILRTVRRFLEELHELVELSLVQMKRLEAALSRLPFQKVIEGASWHDVGAQHLAFIHGEVNKECRGSAS